MSQGRDRDDGVDDAGGGDQVPDRPLERGHRRRARFAAEAGPDRRRLRSVRLTRAVAVRDDHADVARREARVVERSGNGAREAVAVVPDSKQPRGLGGERAAEHFTQH